MFKVSLFLFLVSYEFPPFRKIADNVSLPEAVAAGRTRFLHLEKRK